MSHDCTHDGTRCYTDDEGRMFLLSKAEQIQVNFCPFCGERAEHGSRASQRHVAHKAEVHVAQLVREHDPTETDCTKFLLCIQDGKVRSYDGCHGDEQGVAHAETLIGTLPSGSDDDRRVMLSIDEVPEDTKGMTEKEQRAMKIYPGDISEDRVDTNG